MSQTSPTLPKPSSVRRARLSVQAGQFNLHIARAHELATQLVGIQLAAANLLALAISMASIVAGCVTYAMLNKPGAWPFWIAAGVIGCGLALLIEGMTLGALIRIRLANKQIRTIVLTLEAERDEALAAGKIVGRWKFWRRKRYATRNYRKSRRSSIPLAVIGASASATAGGLFYHQMLANIGFYESIGIAGLFALIVTGTFVSSELYKDLQEEAVREGFRGGSLSEEALREETYRQTNQAVAAEVSNYLTSQNAKDAISKAAAQLLFDVLSELRKKSADRTGQAVGQVTITPARPDTPSLPQKSGQDSDHSRPVMKERSPDNSNGTGHYTGVQEESQRRRPLTERRPLASSPPPEHFRPRRTRSRAHQANRPERKPATLIDRSIPNRPPARNRTPDRCPNRPIVSTSPPATGHHDQPARPNRSHRPPATTTNRPGPTDPTGHRPPRPTGQRTARDAGHRSAAKSGQDSEQRTAGHGRANDRVLDRTSNGHADRNGRRARCL